MRVAVIPTGQMELGGLAKALQRLFPQHDFYSVLEREARPGVPEKVHDQANTARVSLERESQTRANGGTSNRARLVRALAGAVYPPGRSAADLALVLDDLELCNLDQPTVVIDGMRAAVGAHLQDQRLRLNHEDAKDFVCASGRRITSRSR